MYNSNITVSLQMYFWVSLRIPLQCTCIINFLKFSFERETSGNMKELEILVWGIKRIHDWRWIKEPMKWFKTSCTTKSEQIPIWLGVCKSRNFFCELLYGGYWVSALYALPVFPAERIIAGIPRYNQTWPQEKWKKGQFGPFLLQDCRLNTGIIF